MRADGIGSAIFAANEMRAPRRASMHDDVELQQRLAGLQHERQGA